MSRAIVDRVTLVRASLPADRPHPPFVSFARRRAGKRIVDIGGGKGAHIAELAQDGHECVCIDTDLDFLKEAKRAGIAVIQMDAHALGFRTDTFDTALMFELIEHVRNPKQVLAEARRVVTGNVLITTPCHDYSDSLYSLGLFVEGCLPLEHLNFYKTGDLKELIRSQFPACTIVKDEPMFLPGFAEPLYYSRLYAEAFTENVLNQVPETQQTPAMLDDLNEFLRIAERLHLLEEQNSKLASEYATKISTISTLEERLHLLEEQNSKLASEYATKISTISTLEERLHLLEEQNSIAQKTLNEIRNSFGYKFMRFYASRIDRLLPDNTRRGRLKKAIVNAAHAATERRLTTSLRNALKKATRDESPLLQHSISDSRYADWILRNEPTEEDLLQERRIARRFTYRPLISIVTPVWNPPPEMLKQTIDSVLSQTYDNWELCVADGRSEETVRLVLQEFARRDKKIKVRFLSGNLGISGNSNAAIDDARGEFIALLDHDDILAPSALFEVVDCLNRNPELDFIYSDKDSMTADGKRFNPFLKPDWSPDMMLSANYVTHLCVIRTSLVKETGGLRTETDGAQDWDLFLRVTERTNRIFHIARVLYHWRQAPQSVSLAGLRAKPYALEAQLLTLNQHLMRNGREGTIECGGSGRFRVKWRLSRQPDVSIIVHCDDEDTGATLDRCLRSIFDKSSYRSFEVVVVCHNSQPEALQREFDSVHFLRSDYELDYSSANNLGVKHATGDILVFLDPAVEVLTTDWLEELVGWASQPGIGVVGVKLLSLDQRILHSGVVVGLRGYVFDGASEGSWSPYGDTEWYRDYSAVCGSCMATSSRIFNKLGGFEEKLDTDADVDFCLRARRNNYRVLYTPYVRLVLHRPHTLSQNVVQVPDLSAYGESFKTGDPYFNPNLSYESTVPTLKGTTSRNDRLHFPPSHVTADSKDAFFSKRDDSSSSMTASDSSWSLQKPRSPWEGYSDDARVLASVFDFRAEDLDRSNEILKANPSTIRFREVNWFVPDFDNVYWGGIHTILRFADYFRVSKSVENRIIAISQRNPEELGKDVARAFPSLADRIFVIASLDEVDKVPYADVSVCSLWTTAYYLLRFNKTRRKFYFIQDYEPLFYPAGSTYAQAEATYGFGFFGVANTVSLAKMYSTYGGLAEFFNPCVDTRVFYPSEESNSRRPFTVFFYSRPGHPRNCFELGAQALRLVKRELGNNVRIVSAGSRWDPREFGLDGIVEQLGLLSYQETADLYRSCDAGLSMMVTMHPSYIPMQLMASGCLVVSNQNPHTTWLLKDGENCITPKASASSLSEAILAVYRAPDLRARITKTALQTVRERYSNWAPEMEKIYNFMTNPEPFREPGSKLCG